MDITARVLISGHDPTTGAECSGSVVVGVSGNATIEEIVDAAMAYVDNGGFWMKSHGRSLCSADAGTLDSVSMGLSSSASITVVGISELNPPGGVELPEGQ